MQKETSHKPINNPTSHSPSSSSSKRHVQGEDQIDESVLKYTHGDVNFNGKKSKHKALRKTLEDLKSTILKSAKQTANTEILLSQDPGFIEVNDHEKVFKIKQSDIRNNVAIVSASNIFDFQLTNFGPYNLKYSKNGRNLIFGGRKGHVASMDCLRTSIGTELQLQEDVRDVTYLHNNSFFAVAQKLYTYIYDGQGVELHCMRDHDKPNRLDFLPYHYLLVSVGYGGWIKWQDVSIGKMVAARGSGHGPCRVLRHNPHNAVSFLGHSNGVVTLWSPAADKALVSIFCHKAPVADVAIDREGRYMVTAGREGYLKIWDLRKYQVVHTYQPDAPVESIDISEKNLLAIGLGRNVQILRNAFTQPMDVTYLKHEIRTPNRALCAGAGVVASTKALLSSVSVNCVRFRPYEDSLCIGHSHGITSIVVPGAGEPNFDSFESNPFVTHLQQREQEVQGLINKLPADTIGLDSGMVASVDKDDLQLQKEMDELFYQANKKVVKKKDKHKMRGRSKISAKLRTKQKNVIEAQDLKQKEAKVIAEKEAKQEQRLAERGSMGKKGVTNEGRTNQSASAPAYDPLARFVKKS